MRLKVLIPSAVVIDETVSRVIAEAPNGSFCLLPRHIDFVTGIIPGLFSYRDADDEECFVAVDEGVMVKCGSEVLLSVRRAIRGTDLETLRAAVEHEFKRLDERERHARSTLARLEAHMVRSFIQLQ